MYTSAARREQVWTENGLAHGPPPLQSGPIQALRPDSHAAGHSEGKSTQHPPGPRRKGRGERARESRSNWSASKADVSSCASSGDEEASYNRPGPSRRSRWGDALYTEPLRCQALMVDRHGLRPEAGQTEGQQHSIPERPSLPSSAPRRGALGCLRQQRSVLPSPRSEGLWKRKVGDEESAGDRLLDATQGQALWVGWDDADCSRGRTHAVREINTPRADHHDPSARRWAR